MKRAYAGAALLGVATVALELAFRHAAHPTLPWHALPAFDLGFGFAGCVVIVLVSKALGRAGLQRPEEKEALDR